MAAQLTRDPQPLNEVNATVPSALSSLVMRLLAKDPDKRPATADVVLDELDATTISGGVTPVSGGIMAAPARSLTKVFAVIGLLAVILVLVGIALKPNAAVRAQRAAFRDSIRFASESLTRLAAAPTPPPVAPPVLSHQDSMAIADKVNKQVRAARIRDSVSRAKLQDSLQRFEEKKARDSLFKAFGARTAATTKRRIVVVEPRPSSRWPQAEVIGRAVADSLRAMLSKRAYTVVSPDSVRLLRVQPQYQGVKQLADALSSDLLVSIRIDERPPRRGSTDPADSVMLRITAYDLTAKGQYSQRSLPAGGAQWTVHEEVLAPLEALLLQTVGASRR